MNLVEIDAKGFQAFEAPPDRLLYRACGAQQRIPLGGDHHLPVRDSCRHQSARQTSFRPPETVELGRVKPVDPSFESSPDYFVGLIRRNGIPGSDCASLPSENCQVPKPMGVISIPVPPN